MSTHLALLILMWWSLAGLALACTWATISLLLDHYCTRDMWAEYPHVRGAIERNNAEFEDVRMTATDRARAALARTDGPLRSADLDCEADDDYFDVAEARAEKRGIGLNAADDYADWWMADVR